MLKLTKSGEHAATTISEPAWVRWILILFAIIFLAVMLVTPLAIVVWNAFEKGLSYYIQAVTDAETMAALRLTLLAAGTAVLINAVAGLCFAWLIARFRFPGRGLLLTILDIPLAVSPVVAGLMFVLLCGSNGLFGSWLANLDFKIIFAFPGIALVTTFITCPFVARELIPVLQMIGSNEEDAAATLGASGWQIFWRITLPSIKWALLYGIILCNARAMGEFGAVSVVSGHIRGSTNTLPLHVEILYNDYNFAAAFAVASLLTLLALVTLLLKRALEWQRAKTFEGI